MKSKIKIPKGYRSLRIGELIVKGDMYYYAGMWLESSLTLGSRHRLKTRHYIRRVKPKRK